MKKYVAMIAALFMSLALAGCSDSAPKAWVAGTGEIRIVATTNVWASIAAEALGQDLVTSNALIYNINQDPHSFEASARDQLLINRADIVVMNGGGYDDFMTTLVAAAENKPQLVNAFETVGTREDGNEHIWLDIDRVRQFGAALNAEVAKLHPELATALTENLAKFNSSMDALAATEAELKAKLAGKKVIQSEPLISYLLEDIGLIDVTPIEVSRAIEEERDIPPAAIAETKALLEQGDIYAFAHNNVGATAIDNLYNEKTASLGFYELLSQDPDTYEIGDKDYFGYINSCLMTLKLGL